MRISTHVLDTARGRPAANVAVRLEAQAAGGGWRAAGEGRTDASGRIGSLATGEGALTAGTYRLVFETAGYFGSTGQASFFPRVTVEFDVADATSDYHVPLLLSPHGYTTYRGV
jgi:5-hydroxyisourate hydrolase